MVLRAALGLKLRLISTPDSEPPAKAPTGSVLRSVGEGIAVVWNDVQMRTCLLYWSLGAFMVGPVAAQKPRAAFLQASGLGRADVFAQERNAAKRALAGRQGFGVVVKFDHRVQGGVNRVMAGAGGADQVARRDLCALHQCGKGGCVTGKVIALVHSVLPFCRCVAG